MKSTRRWIDVTVSREVAAKVAAAAERVGLSKEQAFEIAKAEPRGTTIFAGVHRKPLVRQRNGK